jgi:hypothetical protein
MRPRTIPGTGSRLLYSSRQLPPGIGRVAPPALRFVARTEIVVSDRQEMAMTTVSNKTKRPLSVPLPGGKKLHLGPGKSGEIAAGAAEHAQLKKMIEAGEIEILAEGHRPADGGVDNKRGHAQAGRAPGIGRRGGDR